MDDQQILKLKKISGKKRRSRNSVSSSTTLVKENFELNQLLDGENTMVYALVEVLKDTEEPAKREKIPLNDRDLFLMMQKFMSSKKEKTDRKILRPSLKRKHGLEYAESNSKLLKEQKHLATCELACQSLGLSDKTNLSCKSSDHSMYNKIHNKDKYQKRLGTQNEKISDQESEQSDLKILYNRHANEHHESKIKRERTSSMTRGTNTDIVQTPKVLGEVLHALNLNMENCSRNEQKIHSRGGFSAKEEGNFTQGLPVQNFLLVPFIVANKREERHKKSKNHSCESLVHEEPRCSHCSQLVEYNSHRREMIQAITSPRSATDLRKDMKPLNLPMGTSSGIKINCRTETESWKEDEKTEASIEPEESKEMDSTKGECFLEEVKTLQTKLNEIIKGLEMNNVIYCHHSCGVFRKEETRNEDNHIKDAEKQDSPPGKEYCYPEKCEIPEVSLQSESSPVREVAPSSQDFSVQVTITKSSSEKTVIVQSEIAFEKVLMLDKLSQFPSEVKMEPPAKRPRRRTLALSKSTPLFRTNVEYRIVKTKRASSLLFNGKVLKAVDYLKLRKLNLLFEGSRPDNGDMFEEELKLPEEDKLKRELAKSDPETGKNADDVPLKNKTLIIKPEGEKEVIATVKPVGKIAKIKIIGNTNLSDKTAEAGTGKIKLELDNTNTIKISNKLTRKINTDITNSSSNSSYNIATNSNSCINNNAQINSNIKEVENNKKPNGSAKVDGNKIVKKEIMSKKGVDATKVAKPGEKYSKPNGLDSNTSQIGGKGSKLKKPTTLVRVTSKGKENGSPKTPDSAKTQKIQVSSDKTKETEVVKPPEKTKSLEKPPPSPEKKSESIDPCETDKKPQSSPNEIKAAPSDESAKPTIHKPANPCPIEEAPAPEKVDQNPDKQSQAVKSIWALTKVILYKDGSQSFQVLEASSSPPGYHLNQAKKTEISENNECKADSDKPAVVNNENTDKDGSSDCNNCSNSIEKSS